MRTLVLVAALNVAAFPALAQTPVTDDLTPTLQPQRYRICNDRPERPTWAEALPIREAWKGLTLRAVYDLKAWREILELQDCACAVRFPSWDAADLEYRERFAALSQAEHTEVQSDLKRQSNDLRQSVRAICEAQGNW